MEFSACKRAIIHPSCLAAWHWYDNARYGGGGGGGGDNDGPWHCGSRALNNLTRWPRRGTLSHMGMCVLLFCWIRL
jgi:hypothetical protein